MDLTPTHRVCRLEEIPLKNRWKYYKYYTGWGRRCALLRQTDHDAEIVLEGGTLNDVHLISQNLLRPLLKQDWLWA